MLFAALRAGVTHPVVAQISSRAGIVGSIALRAIGGGVGLSLAVGDCAADDRAGGEAAQNGCAATVMTVTMPVIAVPMSSVPMPVLHLLQALVRAGICDWQRRREYG